MRQLHDAAVASLRSWAAPTAAQDDLRRRYLDHLDAHAAHADGLDRRCRPDHLTASALVMSQDHRSVLLTLHAKAHRWFQLGGHCEPGDVTLGGAAAREAREESGIEDLVLDPVPVHLDEHVVPFCGDPDDHHRDTRHRDTRHRDTRHRDTRHRDTHHLDVRFVATAPSGAEARASAESLDVAWWPIDALPDGAGDLAALIEASLARLVPTT